MSNKTVSIPYLYENAAFPDPANARKDGLLAFGGDLSVARLKEAYNLGIFPWYDKDDPILWWSPDPRMVLFPKDFKCSKSLSKVIRTGQFNVTFNTAFKQVITKCANVKRSDQGGTWITAAMLDAYCQLNKDGLAKSVEVWQDNELVGGLYGVDLAHKGIFCGESMFSEVSNASKVALHGLCQYLISQNYTLIDCQNYNDHLASLGAVEIPRSEFLTYLD